ncbi:PIN domain-containing protein [Mastigocladopsis repens]|uniref:PIN domain-containing protein n=1 Tax=Mastigocladopsis repens TaxID=221287 RepID=UPI000474D185|nr:PIN domain-containing protein [Mastigocladopsis repens]
MFRILIDADLILEALINRNGCIGDVSELLDRVHPWIQMYVTDIGWQKIYTYASRLRNTKIAEIVVDWLQEKIQICTVDQTILQQARSSPLKDFESAVELVCAGYQELDAIVTHNYDDFAEAPNKFWVWSVAELWVRANLESQLRTTRSIS